VMIHIHAQGLVYVMLTRVKSWKNLKSVNNFQTFKHTTYVAMV
jgi:hypothetical protein